MSFNEKSGIYSVADQDPHKKLNANNAILINTKDPIYFQQTYEKTIQKYFGQMEEQKQI